MVRYWGAGSGHAGHLVSIHSDQRALPGHKMGGSGVTCLSSNSHQGYLHSPSCSGPVSEAWGSNQQLCLCQLMYQSCMTTAVIMAIEGVSEAFTGEEYFNTGHLAWHYLRDLCLAEYSLPIYLLKHKVQACCTDSVYLQASNVVGAGSSIDLTLVVAVPGLTVPWNHTFYLWLATAISFCAHEVCMSRTIARIYVLASLKGPTCDLDCNNPSIVQIRVLMLLEKFCQLFNQSRGLDRMSKLWRALRDHFCKAPSIS